MVSNIPGRSILRITQVLFALAVFGLTAYSMSLHGRVPKENPANSP